MENWVIEHDNGIPAQHGCSDGYTSAEECLAAVAKLQEDGCTVYRWWWAV